MRSVDRALLTWASRILPEGLFVRLLPARLRWDRSALRPATSSGHVALYIGPANSAGQGHRWARAVIDRFDEVDAVSVMTVPLGSSVAAFPTDVTVPLSASLLSRTWRRLQQRALSADFTHALLESGRMPYGDVSPARLPEAVRTLRDCGVRPALLWHGSDIRLPSLHAAEEPDSPFGASGEIGITRARELERSARGFRLAIDQLDVPVFVSTPGLLDVPRSRWLPVAVQLQNWLTNREPSAGRVPVVAYAPSNAVFKGSPLVDEQLRSLENEGLIRYHRVEKLPSAQMPQLYRNADVVIDQFRLGDYGVAACEAMASGCVVIGHVSERVRAYIREHTGRELPILESRLADVGDTVRAVLRDRDAARARSRDGVDFVTHVHDGRMSADALAEFLGLPSPPYRSKP